MDLNPEDFRMEDDTFALASYCAKENIDVMLFPTNWLASDDDGSGLSLHNYWAWRLSPLLKKPIVFIAANRTGSERGVRFAGQSCVMDLRLPMICSATDEFAEAVVHWVSADRSAERKGERQLALSTAGNRTGQ